MSSLDPSAIVINAEQEHKASEGIEAKCRILVIEDERIVLETLGIIFSKAGYEPRGVQSAEAALELLETEEWRPQLAIVDVHLPGMNGVELAITLKARYPEVRVCLYSGQTSTSEIVEEARHQGRFTDPVLAKPVHPSVFLAIASGLQSDAGQIVIPTP